MFLLVISMLESAAFCFSKSAKLCFPFGISCDLLLRLCKYICMACASTRLVIFVAETTKAIVFCVTSS